MDDNPYKAPRIQLEPDDRPLRQWVKDNRATLIFAALAGVALFAIMVLA